MFLDDCGRLEFFFVSRQIYVKSKETMSIDQFDRARDKGDSFIQKAQCLLHMDTMPSWAIQCFLFRNFISISHSSLNVFYAGNKYDRLSVYELEFFSSMNGTQY